MTRFNVTEIVLKAQKHLIERPFDLAHDFTHHYRVYEECIRIIDVENLSVEKNFLAICAWYHDIEERKGQKIDILIDILKKQGLDKKYIDRLIRVIREHSFGEKQTSLESKVLFDADKLDYVSPFRLSWFIQVGKDGFLDKETVKQYKEEWRDRIKLVGAQLHFSYSKEKFAKMLDLARDIMR